VDHQGYKSPHWLTKLRAAEPDFEAEFLHEKTKQTYRTNLNSQGSFLVLTPSYEHPSGFALHVNSYDEDNQEPPKGSLLLTTIALIVPDVAFTKAGTAHHHASIHGKNYNQRNRSQLFDPGRSLSDYHWHDCEKEKI
jgi:hypothetical protein